MQLIKIPIDKRRDWLRREINLEETPLKQAKALQISQLTLDRKEPFHINKTGFVLCFVVTGWLSVYCTGKNFKLTEGEGIVFDPGERHRINKGEGWMISIASTDYDNLNTFWEK